MRQISQSISGYNISSIRSTIHTVHVNGKYWVSYLGYFIVPVQYTYVYGRTTKEEITKIMGALGVGPVWKINSSIGEATLVKRDFIVEWESRTVLVVRRYNRISSVDDVI